MLQIALSLALLTGAGLLARSLVQLLRVDPGFEARGVTVVETLVPRANTTEVDHARLRSLLQRVSNIPGVKAAAWTTQAPLSLTMGGGYWVHPGNPQDRRNGIFSVRTVTHEYFDVMRIAVLQGRAFVRADESADHRVTIVNEDFARRFWPGQPAVGQSVVIAGLGGRSDSYEVVGVSVASRRTPWRRSARRNCIRPALPPLDVSARWSCAPRKTPGPSIRRSAPLSQWTIGNMSGVSGG